MQLLVAWKQHFSSTDDFLKRVPTTNVSPPHHRHGCDERAGSYWQAAAAVPDVVGQDMGLRRSRIKKSTCRSWTTGTRKIRKQDQDILATTIFEQGSIKTKKTTSASEQ